MSLFKWGKKEATVEEVADPDIETIRLGKVVRGMWAIHTSTGQIGKVKSFTDRAIEFLIYCNTNGIAPPFDDSCRGFVIVDKLDNFRAATGQEVSLYVGDE